MYRLRSKNQIHIWGAFDDVFAFLGSRVFRGGKFDMADIQQATLAGGVGISSSAALLISPGAAMIIGIGNDLCNIERIRRSLERFGEKFEAKN